MKNVSSEGLTSTYDIDFYPILIANLLTRQDAVLISNLSFSKQFFVHK